MGAGIAAGQALAPSVAATLDVLAAEIELAGARCIFLDRVIGEVMDRLTDDDRERMLQGLHGVDLLAQHLTSLSAFTRTMSLGAPADLTLPADAAIAEITLGALAERMTAGLGGSDDDGDDADAGDVDMF
jgi:hypothetical protein